MSDRIARCSQHGVKWVEDCALCEHALVKRHFAEAEYVPEGGAEERDGAEVVAERREREAEREIEVAKRTAVEVERSRRRQMTIVPGETFGAWTAMSGERWERYGGTWGNWVHVRCKCGVERKVQKVVLRKGHSTSCGCVRAGRKVAGRSKAKTPAGSVSAAEYGMYRDGKLSPTYLAWQTLLTTEGVILCEQWREFKSFYLDLGPCPPNAELRRIDTAKGYEPGNCEWLKKGHLDKEAWVQQQKQESESIIVEINGRREKLSVWVKERGLVYSTVRRHIKAGADPRDALRMRDYDRHEGYAWLMEIKKEGSDG